MAPPQSDTPPRVEPHGEFPKTGLPRRIHFDGREWDAVEVQEADSARLKRLGIGDAGQEVFAPPGLPGPPARVLVPLPDEADAYLAYRATALR